MAPRRMESPLVDESEYLRIEDTADVGHEFVDVRMYPIAGASDAHNQIVVNLVAAIRPQVRGTECRVYAKDMRLHVSKRLYYYPDLMLVCDPTDNAPNTRSRPCALIEVLSPSTDVVDQREKVLAYKQIPSLLAYLIIDQSEMFIEHHYRINGDIWGIADIHGNGKIMIPCRDISLTVDEIFEDVVFDES